MALNVVLGRAILVIPLPTSLVLPTLSLPLFPHQDPSSSSISHSISSSVSLASASTSSSILVSTSFSTTSSTIPPSTFSEPPTVTPTYTVTTIASDASPASSSGSPQTGFLQNKVLSGVVFGIAGLVGLVLLILLATFAIRRRRNKKLIEDAVSFDPVGMGNYHNALESGLGENVRASVSTGHISNHGPEVRQSPAFIDYAPPAKRSYLPSSNMPSSSPSQGQYNVAAQAYASTYD